MSNAALWKRSGAVLSEHLELEGLSIRAFARDLNVSHETVRKWTAGSAIDRRHLWEVTQIAHYPSALRRDLVADAVGIEAEELFEVLGIDKIIAEARNIANAESSREADRIVPDLVHEVDKVFGPPDVEPVAP